MKKIFAIMLISCSVSAETVHVYDQQVLDDILSDPIAELDLFLHVQNNGSNQYLLGSYEIIDRDMSINANADEDIQLLNASDDRMFYIVNCQDVQLKNISFVGVDNSGQSGSDKNGLYCTASNVEFSGVVFENIYSTYPLVGAVLCVDGALVFNRCEFYDNKFYHANIEDPAPYDGGGSAIAAYGSELNVIESRFERNGNLIGSVAGCGGAIFAYDTKLSINNNSHFSENNVVDSGGAVYYDRMFNGSSNDLQIVDTVFDGNSARNDGGAICVYSYQGAEAEIQLEGVQFSGNICSEGQGRGGAFCLYQGSAQLSVTLYGSDFDDNHASEKGGGIFIVTSSNSEGELVLSGCIINACSAEVGGGIYVENGNELGTVSMDDFNIITCSAETGGALYIHGKAEVEGFVARENSANVGGGVSLSTDSSDIEFRQATIVNNRASGDYANGAGLLAFGSGSLTLVDSDVSGNVISESSGGLTYAGQGAGIYVSNVSLELSNVLLSDNELHSSASPWTRNGGTAISIKQTQGTFDVLLANSTIFNNTYYGVPDGDAGLVIDVSAIPGSTFSLSNVNVISNEDNSNSTASTGIVVDGGCQVQASFCNLYANACSGELIEDD